MTIPVLNPPVTAELSQPYLTPAAFKAYPTWLDLDNLIPGGVQALQDDELADVLLTASEWCCSPTPDWLMRLDAHWVQGEQKRTRANAAGRLTIRPNDVPVRAITAISVGCDPSSLSAVPLPPPGLWIEDGRLVSFIPGGAGTVFSGPALIQFGARGRPFTETWVQWSYVAGFPSTVLAASSNTSVASIQVSNPTGILPGDVLKIYDVGATSSTTGANEAVTVASSYAPALPTVPPVPTVIPLAADPAFAHAAGTLVTGFPRRILQAVICYSVALLMREDVSSEEPAASFGVAARTVSAQSPGRAGGLVNDALGFLAPYAPVLRS